jgi:WD40 repeat protein
MFRASTHVDGAHSSDIWSVCWRGETLLSGGLDGIAKCWQAPECKTFTASTQHPRLGITSVAVLSDSSMAVTCSQDSTLRLYDLPTMTEIGKTAIGVRTKLNYNY